MQAAQSWVKEHPKEAAVAAALGLAVVGGALYYSQKKKQQQSPAPTTKNKPSSALSSPEKSVSQKVPSTPLSETAAAAKAAGNEAYSQKNYAQAIEHYTRGIEASRKEDCAVFYCNRAACHLALKNYQQVVEDCTLALEIDVHYIKALHRRGQAHEALNHTREALHDYTAELILKKFEDKDLTQHVDQLLNVLGRKLAQEFVPTRPLSLPSLYAIQLYLSSFRAPEEETLTINQLLDLIADDKNSGDLHRRLAQAYLQAGEYAKVLPEATEAVSLLQAQMEADTEGDRPTIQRALIAALDLQGMFYHLTTDSVKAVAAFDQILALNPEHISALLHRATTMLEQGRADVAMESYNVAIRAAPNDLYTYFHRGQAYLIKEDLPRAMEDFKKCVEFHPTFVAPYVHLALAQLRIEGIDQSNATFAAATKAFPDDVDVYTYQAQSMLQIGNLPEATRLLDIAIKKSVNSPLPWFFRAQVNMHTGQIDACLRDLEAAVAIDPKFDAAYQQLAQFNLQKKDMPRALEYFNKVIEVARTMDDLTTAFACREAAITQRDLMAADPEMRRVVESLHIE